MPEELMAEYSAAGEALLQNILTTICGDKDGHICYEKYLEGDGYLRAYIIGTLLMLTCASGHLEYLEYESRYETFMQSHWSEQHLRDPDELAQSGFYSTQIGDETKCYHCCVGLKYWEKDDEPKFIHRRHSPKCYHIKLVDISHRLTSTSASFQKETRAVGTKLYKIIRRLNEIIHKDAFKIVKEIAFEEDFIARTIARSYLKNKKLLLFSEDIIKTCHEDEDILEKSRLFKIKDLIQIGASLELTDLI